VTPTPEQQAVIDYPLEPLRVVAGAGAGKTSTMAWRLARLVSGGDVEPERALGITFTNKAADQLADRLRSELPELTEQGRSIAVATYHGFAHSLLVEFGALVGVERGAAVVSAGYQRELMMRALGAGHYDAIDLSAAAHRVEDMSALWGQLGDNLLPPGHLLTLGGDGVAVARSELATALTRYASLKSSLGLLDYSDLIAKAHELMDNHPEIAARLRGRYDVVLLDEFQDTNAAQRLLLLAIFGAGFPVTAVGDADQTIYEWRGASMENFRSFPSHFAKADGSPAATLELSTNYRSGRAILDLANAIKSSLSTEAGVHRLQERPGADAGYVGLAWLHDRNAEAEFIADQASELKAEGWEWRDMACLFRRNGDIAAVREALEARSIPVEVASLGGLLDVPVVADLHAWLKVLGSPDDAVALARILTLGRYRLGLGDLGPLSHWVSHQIGDDAEGAPGWVILEAIDELEAVEGVSAEAVSRLAHFRDRFRELLSEAQGVSLVELCLRILDRTGTWQETEALDGAARLSARLNIYRFLDLAEDWSPLEGRPSLRSFLDYLSLLGEDRSADELDTARLSGENAVALMTVHRAKGLEWPMVFIPAVIDGVLPSKGGAFDDPHTKAWSLPRELRIDGPSLNTLPDHDGKRRDVLRQERLDQERRVAYVAVTRAQHRLYLSGAHWYGGVKPREPSELFEMAVAVDGAELLAHAEQGERPQTAYRVTSPAPDPLFGEGWAAALRRALDDASWPARLAEERGVGDAYADAVDQLGMELGAGTEPEPAVAEPFATSVTGLVTYATCPKRFFWSEVDRLPRRPSAAARRGVDLHRRIELHNRGAMALEWEHEAAYDVIPGEGGDTTERTEEAFTTFTGSRFAASRPSFVEVPFDLGLDAGRVRGRIDAIYTAGDDWEIVDFKSGKARRNPADRVQLEAYAIAAADVGFGAPPPSTLRVTFVYLGDGLVEITEEVDSPWMDAARAHLDELAEGAAAERFPTKPSAACGNCDFLRFCDDGTAFLNA
jgi:DNA helicase-2/ATP-dependent DNA helicase PcrA